jgi:transposase
MHIDCRNNNGKPYLVVLESYSVKVDGVRKNLKRTIRSIGPLSRFDDGKPEFVSRLKKSFLEGAPIIEGLDDLVANKPRPRKVSVTLDRNDPETAFSNPKNIGYFILDGIYDALGINDVLHKYKSKSRLEYDLNGHAKALIFGRCLSPDSKCATWRARGKYLFEVVSSEKLIEVYRALDVLDGLSVKIQQRMNTKIEKHIGRNKTICFYDVTNYWFEIDDPDEDMLSEFGEVIREGLRKSGPSKAKNRKPIVQMGLFMDDNGIPVSYKIFPGNHIDQTTLRPTMKETLNKMGYERTIVVSDGGLNSGKNLAHIIGHGNGYIVSKSAKGSTKAVKEWILDDDSYIWNAKRTFKIKSKVRTRTIKDEDGNKMEITEKIISYWSKSQYDYAMHENRKFIEYLNEVAQFPDKLKDKQPKLKQYLVETKVVKETGEVVDTVSRLSLDTEKIESDLGLMGFYTLMTSELDMDEHEVIDKYHGLSKIENSFRIIKSDLEGRPVFVQTEEHINAHFLICFIALTIMRIIQYKILTHEGKATNSTRKWELGLSAERIKEALASFMADALSGGYYRLTKINDDLARIIAPFGANAALEIPTESEIRQLKYAIDKGTFM